MINFTKNIFFAALILVFGFLSMAIAQDKDPSADVYTAFTLLETYIETGDYDSAWKVTAEYYQGKMFNRDFENFKKYYSGKKYQPYEIESVRLVSPDTANLTILRDNQQQVIVMIWEKGEWKFAGEGEDPMKEEGRIESGVDYSSPAIQVYLTRENAFKNRDYETAWELTLESIRQDRWKLNFESFKDYYSKNSDKLTNYYTNIKQVVTVNPEKVEIELRTGDIFVMRQENEKWYWAGALEDFSKN